MGFVRALYYEEFSAQYAVHTKHSFEAIVQCLHFLCKPRSDSGAVRAASCCTSFWFVFNALARVVHRYLSDKLKYVDRDRVGLWGRGYGGFSTAMILSEDRVPGVFACGIAVAPVTNWAHYGNVGDMGNVGRVACSAGSTSNGVV